MFGCSAYTHVPKDERKKLDPKAKKCIFLGYGTVRKGYGLYDNKTSKMSIAVTFLTNPQEVVSLRKRRSLFKWKIGARARSIRKGVSR